MLKDLTREELKLEEQKLRAEFEETKGLGLKLDISRGKPSKEQLALSMDMLDVLNSSSKMISEDGFDTRNYGCLTGIAEGKRLMADLMDVRPEQVIVFDGSSLNIMYDTVQKCMAHGVMGHTPWQKLPEVKFLCPVPGYDRHFAVTEAFGVTMLNVPILEDGPDMDLVEKYVSEDPAIKGICCVPKYGNPAGTVYSDEVVRRFAALKPAAPDFRIFWDNAYNVHHLDFNDQKQILNILDEAEKAGNPDIVYVFGSFSKITFPGSSVSGLASSKANLEDIAGNMKYQTIGHNKIMQLMHARYFPNREAIDAHMKKHAAIMKPKFDAVEEILTEELGGLGIAGWSHPAGGYFVSFNTMEGCAKKVVAMMKEAGVTMTGAGATYPYHKDPEDRNIRIAPSFATLEEVREAIRIFAKVVKLASVEKLLGE